MVAIFSIQTSIFVIFWSIASPASILGNEIVGIVTTTCLWLSVIPLAISIVRVSVGVVIPSGGRSNQKRKGESHRSKIM
jgi:hypothetical protein